MKADEVYGVLKTYINTTLVGMGALKGAPCTIKSLTKSGTLNTVVFEWTDTNNVKHESTMLVNDGFAPTITVKTSTDNRYVLTITDVNGSYDTPNLRGGGGGGGAYALEDLDDVDLANLANGDALIFDSTSQMWKNVALATVAKTGDYADLSNKPTIPTKTSDLTNDSNFVASSDLATVATTGAYSDLSGTPTIPTKTSDLTNDSNFVQSSDLATVATTGAYSDLSGTPSIPTKTSDLTNDSGFVASSSLATVATTGAYSDLSGTPNLATVATTGAYSDLSGTPTIPTKTSDLTNDSNFVASTSLATVATTGAYSDLSGTPTLATVATTGAYADLSGKPTIRNVTVLTGTLASGATTVTFTNIPTTGNYMVDFFAENGANYTALDISTPGTAVLTYEAPSSAVTVYCRIEEV